MRSAMLANGDGQVLLLAASIRSLEQLLYCFLLEVDLVTAPAKILQKWADEKFPMPPTISSINPPGAPFLTRKSPWTGLGRANDLRHDLTDKGLDKFAEDYRKTIAAGG
jgi:transaldolase